MQHRPPVARLGVPRREEHVAARIGLELVGEQIMEPFGKRGACRRTWRGRRQFEVPSPHGSALQSGGQRHLATCFANSDPTRAADVPPRQADGKRVLHAVRKRRRTVDEHAARPTVGGQDEHSSAGRRADLRSTYHECRGWIDFARDLRGLYPLKLRCRRWRVRLLSGKAGEAASTGSPSPHSTNNRSFIRHIIEALRDSVLLATRRLSIERKAAQV